MSDKPSLLKSIFHLHKCTLAMEGFCSSTQMSGAPQQHISKALLVVIRKFGLIGNPPILHFTTPTYGMSFLIKFEYKDFTENHFFIHQVVINNCTKDGCSEAYKGLSDHFYESHNLYSSNGRFKKIAQNSVKNSTKFMDSICRTVVNNLVKELVQIAGSPKRGFSIITC